MAEEVKEPPTKRRRVGDGAETQQQDHFKRLPESLLVELWSFAHDIEAFDSVPDRDHYSAFCKSRSLVTHLVIDEQWSKHFEKLSSGNFVRVLGVHYPSETEAAESLVRLFSPTRVATITVVIKNVVLDVLLREMMVWFRNAETLFVTVDIRKPWKMTAESTLAAAGLFRLPSLKSLTLNIPASNTPATTDTWYNSSAASTIPFRHLTTLHCNMLTSWLNSGMRNGVFNNLTDLHTQFDEHDTEDLKGTLKSLPSLEVLTVCAQMYKTSAIGQPWRQRQFADAIKYIAESCKKLKYLAYRITGDMDYPPVESLQPLLGLGNLQRVYLTDDEGGEVKKRPDSSYDTFAKQTLVAWPGIIKFGLGLPVTSEFFKHHSVPGGAHLKFFQTSRDSENFDEIIDREKWASGGERKNVVVSHECKPDIYEW